MWKGSSHCFCLLLVIYFDEHLSGVVVALCSCSVVADSLLFCAPFPSPFFLSVLICLFCLLQPCDPLSCASSVSLLPLFLSPCCSLFVCFVYVSLSLSQPYTNHFSFSLCLFHERDWTNWPLLPCVCARVYVCFQSTFWMAIAVYIWVLLCY